MCKDKKKSGMVICDRIKEVRKVIGLTQAKFAEQIAISASYLAELEHSTKTVNERILRLIVGEFNVNEHWLRTGDGEMFNPDVDAKIVRVVSLYRSLDKPFQECALIQLEGLTKLYSITQQSEN